MNKAGSKRMDPLLAHMGKTALRYTSGRAMGLVKNRPRKFVIMTNGRSASNLLVDMLGSQKSIWKNGEIFGEYRLNNPAVRSLIRTAGAERYLKGAFRRSLNEDVIINKILYYQIEKEYGESFGISGMSHLSSQLITDESYSFIHLKRRDHLSALISRRLAKENSQWVGGTYKADTLHIDPDWATNHLNEIAAWENRYDSEVPASRLLSMYYEDLISQPQTEIDRVCEFIGVDSFEAIVTSRKQNKKTPAQAINNYAELKAALANTNHAGLFVE